MKLGLFTPVFGRLSFVQLLDELRRYPEIRMLELGIGGWPGSSHIDLDGLLGSRELVHEYRERLQDAGLGISALSCHGNPLHPMDEIAQRDHGIFRKTLRLANLLEVPVVITFSGCPGGSPGDRTPNWITTAWPPEYGDALAWQWESKVVPYWTQAAALAAEHGAKIAIEAHPGFSVYNPETLLRLRAAVGKTLGINLDPSHLWWQGMEMPEVVAELGDSIFHVHAKDVALHRRQIMKTASRMRESFITACPWFWDCSGDASAPCNPAPFAP